MSKQDQQGWKSMEFNMTTAPSVGRFSNDQQPTLYVKGSSAKFDDNDGRKTMAPYSNHGQLSHQASQQSASDIVDLRTALGANSWICDYWPSLASSISVYYCILVLYQD
ncbi:hypothetical protein KC19_2G250500 [Ceratodon purpureus]|uniref:Uncharacterized protein n=1 Tax=Ceratodon purpureus TaxID=3225 RepID=A0A8T0J1H5_CERPU|nr:hypothetical protein KC19_2G250500 [Ceratodon purpureus]